ncbi:AAA family ATPase [Deinococcus lacus]|uniref:AAA family ATPase n=1 Tax=Deinococcus lacus TaxID=392561 RepID=A0ABW1YFW6_9DEIO
MQTTHIPKVSHAQAADLILNLGLSTTVMLWGVPGIGKTSIARQLAHTLGMEDDFVVMLGSQMSPEDLAVPIITPEHTTVLCPPASIADGRPKFILIDEVNAAEQDVMRAFFSLILDRRIGHYTLPAGSVIMTTGNPIDTNSVARPLPAPLMTRMFHAELKLESAKGWLTWAYANGIHPLVTGFIEERGLKALLGESRGDDKLSTNPRSWENASRALYAYGISADLEGLEREERDALAGQVTRIAAGAIWHRDAEELGTWLRNKATGVSLRDILGGLAKIPFHDQTQAVYLLSVLKTKLEHELPALEENLRGEAAQFSAQAMNLVTLTAQENPELAYMVLNSDHIPAWWLERYSERVGMVGN